MNGLERGIVRSVWWLLAGLAPAPLLLAAPTPHGSTPWVLFHLSVLVVFGLALTMSLARLLDEPWFAGRSRMFSVLASAVSVVALATGVVALVTLASSAALRFDPSLQFLQLLSALDIAWAAGATAIGAVFLRHRLAGWLAGGAIVVICIWSVATYLYAVGFTDSGGWLVDGAAMWRYILPFDIAAALMAVTTLALGARRRATDQRIEQPSRQS
jgi:hypothetical protein